MSERFAFNNNGTFHDANTGREWTVAVSEPMTWADAQDHARDCRVGGHADWRVPERPELDTLVDLSTHSPATWPELREITPSDWLWTATPYAPSSGSAWVVYFDGGCADGGNVGYTRRVRCVRKANAFDNLTTVIKRVGANLERLEGVLDSEQAGPTPQQEPESND